MNEQEKWLVVMRSLLHHNVPRFIAHIKAKGGVSEEEWQWLRHEDDDDPTHFQGILARADEYLLYPKTEEIFKKSLFVLVLGLAIMSFIPGGICVFGLIFSSEIEGFVKLDET